VAVARQRPVNTLAIETQRPVYNDYDAVFCMQPEPASMRSVPRLYNEDQRDKPVSERE
jgi:hypothetical protein